MALFHFHVTQIKRSAGQSAVAAAAYRSGEKLHSEYYGEDSDYTRKGGVICSEILLPPQAPPSFSDRETLWNAVEKVERGKRAQLAYSFDIALQNEFSMQENIELARHFLLEQCVSRGMVADYAIHQPDKKDGGIQNPHFHVMCPIRPIEPDGKWGNKQRREYVLDEQGERIRDEAGNYVFNAVPTTDWGKPETLEFWREQWAQLCNTRFAEKGLDCRIDHRSYERQGVEQIPTQHEGPTVRAMEAKGICTDKGDLNRWVRSANAKLNNIRQIISKLLAWLKEVKAELSKPQEPLIVDLLGRYFAGRNAGAWSQKAKLGNLKSYSAAVSYLHTNNISTLSDLESRLDGYDKTASSLKSSLAAKEQRIKKLDRLVQLADFYREGKPVYDKLNEIKWKKKREEYAAQHERALDLFYMARRELKPYQTDGNKLPLKNWQKEKAVLEQEYTSERQQLSAVQQDLKSIRQIRYAIESIRHEQERTAQTKNHKCEIEI
ncbi:MAG: MobA/MobL family protein [Flintibacter sp.]|uniref:MobQ family relaxase n=1 Tax=Flintibacter sp. TaxID=1918624 RepID=UPI002D8007CD|nr:MobQ family relaxase [Flintibacter sp.]MCI7159925.1 MobA/MobL family protein [Flintibacter sp.]